MEPQDDNGLFAQAEQDTLVPDGQTEGQFLVDDEQDTSDSQAPGQDGGNMASDDNIAVPSEDGMAEDEDLDLDDEDSDEETVPGDGLLQSGSV